MEAVPPLGRRERAVLLAVVALGLTLRLAYLMSQRDDVLFEHPILDEQRYVDAARAGGDEARPYWQPPGVIYFVAAVMRVAGPGLLWPRLLETCLSAAACLLLFALARRWFSARVALACAALLAIHGVVIFESTELLPATFILFFDLLALYLLDETRGAWRALAAGLALGISALFSPVILPFAVVAALRLRRARLIGALVAGVLLPIAPVTARNFAHGHEWVLVSTNGGLNLYLGNNEHYDETFALRPGRHWEELTGEPERSGISAPGAASNYFAHKASAFAVAQPAHAARLLAHKLYLYFNGGEIARDSDVYSARAGSAILTVLIWPRWFPDGVLLPLALIGALWSWRDRRLRLLHAFVAWQALITALFFVTARHRLPALGALSIFAVAGAVELSRSRRAWALLCPLLLVLNLPTREAALSFGAERDFYRGLAWLRDRHDPVRAAVEFRRAAEADPSDARAWFELGNALDAAGQTDESVAAWQRAAAADPWDSRARRRISQALTRRGDSDGAIAALQNNIDARLREPAHYAPDWLNLAFLYVERGQLDRARDALARARSADAVYYDAHIAAMAAHLSPAARAALDL